MPDPDPNMPALVVEGGTLDGFTMNIAEGTTVVVGSGRLANLRIDHPDIELAHVKVTWDALGIAMRDNGSRHGTWVDNEQVESAALLDGDVISFTAPGSPSSAPRVRVQIPEGTVAAPPPPPPEAEDVSPEGAAVAPPARAPEKRKPVPRRKGTKGGGVQIPGGRIALVAVGVVLLGLVGWGVSRVLIGSAPELSGVSPARAEVGATVTLTGSGFAPDAAGNTVRFGTRSAPAQAVAGGAVLVKVPALGAGVVPVTVETSGGRSKPVSLEVLVAVEAGSLDPAGALPGDEVTLRGKGLDGQSVSLTVGGAEAVVVATEPTSVRFTMPALEAAPGSEHPVVVTVDGRSPPPVNVVFGRLPLVTSFDPARAVAGDRVRIRGLGFPDDPARTVVTFDDVPALVLSASAKEIEVVAPLPPLAQRETLARVLVQAGGRTSSASAFPLLRLTSGSYVLRFFAARDRDATGPAFVDTEIGPVLMLTWKASAPSAAHRALEVAEALNAAVQRPRRDDRPVFEARDEPSIGVGLAGAAGIVVPASPQDAAAYQSPPGLPNRGGPPTPLALARWWAALLNDYVVVATSPGQPSHVGALSPSGGAAMARLRTVLPWQYRSRVANARVAGMPGDLRRRLRDAVLQVP